jgi:Uma2 family endonuclease
MAIGRVLPPATPGQRAPMSYEEWLAWADEDAHTEWVDGEGIIYMPPAVRHQALSSFLHWLVKAFVDLFDLGEVHAAPLEMRAREGGAAREPDILFIARENLGRLGAQRLVGPADLIVEIISPESVTRDRVEKLREYATEGVREYWLVDSRPAAAPFAAYALTDAGDYAPIAPDDKGRYHSTVLPGFWLDPSWLVREPLPKPLAAMRLIAREAFRAALEAEGEI